MSNCKGTVKWMNSKKGFGMIHYTDESGENTDVFFHYSDLEIDGFKYLPPGTPVVFELVNSSKSIKNNGLKAVSIRTEWK